MKKLSNELAAFVMAVFILAACTPTKDPLTEDMKARLAQFEEVTLTTDLSWLSENEREIIRILMDAADIMDDIFWIQYYVDKE